MVVKSPKGQYGPPIHLDMYGFSNQDPKSTRAVVAGPLDMSEWNQWDARILHISSKVGLVRRRCTNSVQAPSPGVTHSRQTPYLSLSSVVGQETKAFFLQSQRKSRLVKLVRGGSRQKYPASDDGRRTNSSSSYLSRGWIITSIFGTPVIPCCGFPPSHIFPLAW